MSKNENFWARFGLYLSPHLDDWPAAWEKNPNRVDKVQIVQPYSAVIKTFPLPDSTAVSWGFKLMLFWPRFLNLFHHNHPQSSSLRKLSNPSSFYLDKNAHIFSTILLRRRASCFGYFFWFFGLEIFCSLVTLVRWFEPWWKWKRL